MIKNLKKITPLVIIPVCIIIALIGYNSSQADQPYKIVFKSKGDPVIFSHEMHSRNYSISGDKITCDQCHHNTSDEGENKKWKCRYCHKRSSDTQLCETTSPHELCIISNCIKCHKKIDTVGVSEAKCNFCHKKGPGSGSPEKVLFKSGNKNVVFDHFKHKYGNNIACSKCHHKTNEAIKTWKCRKCHSKDGEQGTACKDNQIHSQCTPLTCTKCHKETVGTDENNCKFCHKH